MSAKRFRGTAPHCTAPPCTAPPSPSQYFRFLSMPTLKNPTVFTSNYQRRYRSVTYFRCLSNHAEPPRDLKRVRESVIRSFHACMDSGGGLFGAFIAKCDLINPYPTAFPYGNGMVLHFYQQQESSTTKTVHKVINKGLKAYV